MGRRTFVVLFILCALNTGIVSATWPLVVTLFEQLHLESAMQGSAYALVGLGMLIAGASLGSLCDRFGKRKVCVAGLLLLAGGWAVAAWSASAWALGLAQLLTGLAGVAPAAVSAYFGSHTPAHSRTRAFAWMLAACGIGQASGPQLFKWLVPQGTPVVCTVLAGLALATGLFALVALKDSVAHEDRPDAAGWDATRALARQIRLPLGAYCLLFATGPIIGIYVPLHAKLDLHASAPELSVLFSSMGVTMMTAPLVVKLLNHWLSERAASVVSFSAVVLGAVACALAPSVGWLTAGFFIWALAWDVTTPYIKANASRRARPEQQALTGAAEQWSAGILVMVIPLGASALYSSAGPLVLFGLAAPLALGGAWLMHKAGLPSARPA